MKILLSGNRGSGKSLLLYALFHGSNCGGVICVPSFQNGDYIGKDAIGMSSGKKQMFCRLKEKADCVGIESGNYIISEDGMKFFRDELEASLEKKFIIIDEFGPLELRKKGVYPVVKQIIESDKNVVVVVRKTIESCFIALFPQDWMRIHVTETEDNIMRDGHIAG